MQTLEENLNKVNFNKLDQFEQIVYNNLIEKSNLSKSNSLQIIINNVEGDYYQLSTQLKRIAIKFKM